MFKPAEPIVVALRDLYACLGAIECGRATSLNQELQAVLSQRRPDITDILLSSAQAARQHGLELGAELTAASCRAGCVRLGKRHPGASIEVRVPPFAAVQIGFDSGPTHTRGTPPNVVEMEPNIFIDLATGRHAFEESRTNLRISGTHAEEVQQAFPLWIP
ncbi:MAG: sterol carrier family protein [Arachnia sp.]